MARIKGKNIRVPTDGKVSPVAEDDKPSYAPSPETTDPTGTTNKPMDTTEDEAPKPAPPSVGDAPPSDTTPPETGGAIPDIGKRKKPEDGNTPTPSDGDEKPSSRRGGINIDAPKFTSDSRSADKDHLANVDISKRTGNYLLSIGLPRSGKTVLQSFMTYYMDVGGKLNVNLDNKEPAKYGGAINHEAQRIKTVWLESWKKGLLPDSTPVGEDEIRELRLNVTNQENTRQKFNFSFLEVSGENFLEMVPDEQRNSSLFDRLKAFLSNKKINMNLAFVLKHDEEQDLPSCDALFTNFIDVVTNQLNLKISNRAGLILILPNTKAIFGKEDWEKSRKDPKFYEKIMKDYIYQNFPATYKIFDNWKKSNRGIMSFYIGDVDNDVLTNKDYQDVKAFIGLNYRMFTGKKLAPKFSWIRALIGG